MAAIQQSLRKFRQIVRGRKQSSLSGYSTHAPRRRIVHHSAQHVMVLVFFSRCGAQNPRMRRKISSLFQPQRNENVFLAVLLKRLA